MGECIGVTAATVPVSNEVDKAGCSTSTADAFRLSMRNLAASVSVVTIGSDTEASGFTATSVVSLSVETPSLLVGLNRASTNWPMVKSYGRFAINILSCAHVDIAETFAGRSGLRGRDRYTDPRWLHESGRVPRLRDALAVIECDLEEALERYSHAILIGRVTSVVSDGTRGPLVYWQGKYTQINTNGSFAN